MELGKHSEALRGTEGVIVWKDNHSPRCTQKKGGSWEENHQLLSPFPSDVLLEPSISQAYCKPKARVARK